MTDTILGLDSGRIRAAVEGVTDPSVGSLDDEAVNDRFARAIWSFLAEPGDRLAGLMVKRFGAETSLRFVLDDAAAPFLMLSLGSAVDVTADELATALVRWRGHVRSRLDFALDLGARHGATLHTPLDLDWPTGLNRLGLLEPLALWVRGKVEAYRSLDNAITLVGARAATGYGEHVTLEIARDLARKGYTIVSGGAYGIDAMATRSALAAGGTTVTYLSGGVDHLYPAGNQELLIRAMETGAVISEMPPGTVPTKWRFLQRNRMLGAGSLATIVIEAGWNSSALNAASYAKEYQRPVGAVPGPVTSVASVGCHRLIRVHGATLVTNADEVAQLASPTN